MPSPGVGSGREDDALRLSATWTGGLYLHLPFCLKKCPYCDFPSVPGTDGAWRHHLREIAEVVALLPPLEPVTVFWGGGTPTWLSLEALEELAGVLRALPWPVSTREATVEANPGTVTIPKLERLRAWGFDRISLGAQSFFPTRLRQLERPYGPDRIREAVRWARGAGFRRLNLDLLFGYPGASWPEAEADLEAALACDPEHLSWYQLTLDPGTPWGRRVQDGLLALPGDDTLADHYRRGQELLEGRGFRQYEISNFALPGEECWHNLRTWRNLPCLGLGRGAVSYVEGWRTNALGSLLRGEPLRPGTWAERLAPARRAAETLMLGLRTREGIHGEEFYRQTGFAPEQLFPGALRRWQEAGFLVREGERIYLPPRAFFLSNAILADLVIPEGEGNAGVARPS